MLRKRSVLILCAMAGLTAWCAGSMKLLVSGRIRIIEEATKSSGASPQREGPRAADSEDALRRYFDRDRRPVRAMVLPRPDATPVQRIQAP